MPTPDPLATLLPRPAPVWPGLTAAAAMAAGCGLALDPAGPLRHLRLAERLALGGPFSPDGAVPMAVAAGGFAALLITALIDRWRISRWAADVRWRGRAVEWCADRLPERHGLSHERAEFAAGRAVLAERVAERWGRYYLFAFVLPLVALLAGLYFLKTPPAGIAAEAIAFSAFKPLLVGTAGVIPGLLTAVAAARGAGRTLAAWEYEAVQAASERFAEKPREQARRAEPEASDQAAGGLPAEMSSEVEYEEDAPPQPRPRKPARAAQDVDDEKPF